MMDIGYNDLKQIYNNKDGAVLVKDQKVTGEMGLNVTLYQSDNFIFLHVLVPYVLV